MRDFLSPVFPLDFISVLVFQPGFLITLFISPILCLLPDFEIDV